MSTFVDKFRFFFQEIFNVKKFDNPQFDNTLDNLIIFALLIEYS